MNTALHHIVAQLRIEEMRHEADRARRARSAETAQLPSAPRSRVRTWASRHRHRAAATRMSAAARPGGPRAPR
jgi:hypothetical protein